MRNKKEEGAFNKVLFQEPREARKTLVVFLKKDGYPLSKVAKMRYNYFEQKQLYQRGYYIIKETRTPCLQGAVHSKLILMKFILTLCMPY